MQYFGKLIFSLWQENYIIAIEHGPKIYNCKFVMENGRDPDTDWLSVGLDGQIYICSKNN